MAQNFLLGSGFITFRSGSQSIRVGHAQEWSFDYSVETKALKGNSTMPIFNGKFGETATIKAKNPIIDPRALNVILGGGAISTTGTVKVFDQAHAAAASVVVSPTGTGMTQDYGVFDANGVNMLPVTGAPAVGQYSASLSTATYTFNASEAGTLLISYAYGTGSGVQSFDVSNQTIGPTTTFELVCQGVDSAGKTVTYTFDSATCDKLGIAFKNEDFASQDLEFKVQPGASGRWGNITKVN